jgi:hypothetical protein
MWIHCVFLLFRFIRLDLCVTSYHVIIKVCVRVVPCWNAERETKTKIETSKNERNETQNLNR